MIVVGAAFTADAARHAAQALARLPDVAPNAIARAPLGAVGRVSEGKFLVAVCVTDGALDEVARIIEEFGGEIVSRQRYTEPTSDLGSQPVHGKGPINMAGTAVPGRSDN
jgi:hypothetical protein